MSNTKRMEAGFVFAAQPADADFSVLHVEPLLDQAADLLDRGVRERATYDDVAARYFLLVVEMNQYAALDAIHSQEEAAGYYDVPYQLSNADYDAAFATQISLADVAGKLNSINAAYYSPAAVADQIDTARRTAWLTGQEPYSTHTDSYNSPAGTLTGVSDSSASDMNDPKFSPSEPATDFPHFAVAAADSASNWRLNVEADSQFAQMSAAYGQASAANLRVPGMYARAQWDANNAGFGRQRTLAARALADIKAKAITDVDGALNYAKRLDSLRSRFQSDFRDALARLEKVRHGMFALYGYDVALPDPVASGINYFDDCLLWARQAIQWHIRFMEQEQSFVMPLSVRQLMKPSDWTLSLQKKVFSATVPPTVFANMSRVRLRGISLTVATSDPETLWQATVQAPPTSTPIPQSTGGPIKVGPAYTNVPPCRLGRVATRNSAREPDVVGRASLYNANPIGQWVVTLTGAIPAWKDPDDLVLDLLVSFRTPPPPLMGGQSTLPLKVIGAKPPKVAQRRGTGGKGRNNA